MRGFCEPDEQAAAEKVGTGLIMALLGVREFTNLGNLCVDDVFSAEQLVIDMEILDFIEKLIESTEIPECLLDKEGIIESIQRAVEIGQGFLTDEKSVTHYKEIYKPMPLFKHNYSHG